MSGGSGRWIADNSAYKSEQEPYDAYGIEWHAAFDDTTMRGRLFGLKDGIETGDFWEFRQFWHPHRKEAVLQQFGTGGAVGLGTLWRDGQLTKADQQFYSSSGSVSRSGHASYFDAADRHVTDSFEIVNDEWLPRRHYVWQRSDSGGDAAMPEIFAPDIISSDLPEFSITFSPDGSELYFNRTPPDRSKLYIYTSRWSGSAWSAPVIAPFSGEHRDVDPFLTVEGKRLYFSSDRPRAGSPESSFSTWYVERTASGWSEPVDPGAPLNSAATDIFVSLSRDGTLVFSSERGGDSRIHSSRQQGGQWQTPVSLMFGDDNGGGNPMISPDGNYLIMVIVREETGPDLFYACRDGDAWLAPQPLPDTVNSVFADFAPAIHAASDMLYFTSERPGITAPQDGGVRPPGDIYRVPLRAAGIRCNSLRPMPSPR